MSAPKLNVSSEHDMEEKPKKNNVEQPPFIGLHCPIMDVACLWNADEYNRYCKCSWQMPCWSPLDSQQSLNVSMFVLYLLSVKHADTLCTWLAGQCG